MAAIYGTPTADNLVGTADDDTIIGYKGADGINGLGGDDTITGGGGADGIDGGEGDDTITGDGGDDAIDGGDGNDTITGGEGGDEILGGAGNDTIIGVDNAGDKIDGGDGTDTLVTDLADTDDLTQGASGAKINGITLTGLFDNMELVQVTNASDFILTLGTDAAFGFDQTLTSDNGADAGPTAVEAETYVSNVITENGFAADEAEGLTVNGTTYADTDSFTTAGGGTVTVGWVDAVAGPPAVNGYWTLTYTPDASQLLAVGYSKDSSDDVADETITVTVGDGTDTADISVGLTINLDEDINASAETDAVTLVGDDQSNTLISGEGDDTLIGNAGGDRIILNGGDNTVWAGATDDAGDSVTIYGDGANTVGLGVGDDDFYVNGDGNNTLFGGEGDDGFYFSSMVRVAAIVAPMALPDSKDSKMALAGGTGDNTAWGGVGDDTFSIGAGADGANMLGGGEGADIFDIYGDGDNTLYLGADDAIGTNGGGTAGDYVNISGDGDNTVFGGAGTNGTGINEIDISGTGANTVYNGNGDDIVNIAGSATGDNTLWGGAGDDTFNFTAGGTGTVAFAAGNGLDTITGFDLASGKTKIDVTELGFTDANDVLNSMSNTTGGDTLLFVEAGQAVTFTGLSVVDFQGADPADWLVV